MLISVVGFALMNLTVKYLKGIPATELVLFRSLVSLVLSYIIIKRKKLNPLGNNRKLLMLRGVFGVIALTLFFYTLQYLPLGSAVTIQYLSPMFTAFFAIFLLKQPTRPLQWFYFLVAFAGVFLIRGFDPNITPLLLLAGLGSAVFAGLAYNVIARLKDSDHPIVVVFYFPLIATPAMLVFSFFYWETPQGWQWPLLLLMGVLTQIAQLYMTKAYQVSAVNQVAGLKYLGLLFALGFDFFLFGITYPPMAMLGIGFVLSGVLLNIIHKGKLT